MPEETLSPPPTALPGKLYFRIGEVSRLAGVEPHVLRYWETEFPSLKPKKSSTGQRLYRRKDVETVLEVKRLLYEKRYTIEGARKMFQTRPKPSSPDSHSKPRQGDLFEGSTVELEKVRNELREILKLLG